MQSAIAIATFLRRDKSYSYSILSFSSHAVFSLCTCLSIQALSPREYAEWQEAIKQGIADALAQGNADGADAHVTEVRCMQMKLVGLF